MEKVLIIDADPQANSTSLFQLDEVQENYKSIKDIFENVNTDPEEIIYETGFDNLHIIGSSIFLTATEMKLVPETAREFCLKRYFKKNKNFFNKYDIYGSKNKEIENLIKAGKGENTYKNKCAEDVLKELGGNKIKKSTLSVKVFEDLDKMFNKICSKKKKKTNVLVEVILKNLYDDNKKTFNIDIEKR